LVVDCLDIAGKECTIELTGWNARVFGHEYDHLYGINFIDRVSKLRLSMAKKKRNNYIKKYDQLYKRRIK
jgi:peptide deformylase